ncbi:MAG: PIG-L deacetylase family protein [Chloroflexota bacterium]|jgi:LmbE family N-acetylglucosaminyl deacetylase|nr:PIG-L deacetylase family protein [Chloroflexota bacterium]
MADKKKLNAPDWSGVKRVLVIVAHPDDADFTCAGTVMQMARQDIDVTYMILTNGDKGNHNPEITRNQLIAMRKIEQRRSAELCGVKQVLFMGEEDGFLQPTPVIRKRVTREIRRIRPELIICPHPDRYLVGDGYINHPDHRNAGLIALEAIFPAADNPMFYPDMMDEGYLPHKISQLYVSGHDEPNIEVDISADAERKVAAILCHVSQFDEPEKAADSWRKRWSETGPDGEPQVFERFKCMKFG